MARKAELFPQPDGPINETNSPGRTSKLSESVAWVSP